MAEMYYFRAAWILVLMRLRTQYIFKIYINATYTQTCAFLSPAYEFISTYTIDSRDCDLETQIKNDFNL